MTQAEIKETDLAYAAGFIDGEGCIDIHRRKAYIGSYERVVQAAQTEESVLHFIRSLFGGTVGKTSECRVGRATCWLWRVHGENAFRVCTVLLPYLKVKIRQAEILIDFPMTKYFGGHSLYKPPDMQKAELRLRLHQEMRQLNKTGPGRVRHGS